MANKREHGIGLKAAILSLSLLTVMAGAAVASALGIIMPMSTWLIAVYYTRDKMMGYSSAMNYLGGNIATLAAGIMAGIGWRMSFLVYLLGLLSVVLCLLFLPDYNIGRDEKPEKKDLLLQRLKAERECSENIIFI